MFKKLLAFSISWIGSGLLAVWLRYQRTPRLVFPQQLTRRDPPRRRDDFGPTDFVATPYFMDDGVNLLGSDRPIRSQTVVAWGTDERFQFEAPAAQDAVPRTLKIIAGGPISLAKEVYWWNKHRVEKQLHNRVAVPVSSLIRWYFDRLDHALGFTFAKRVDKTERGELWRSTFLRRDPFIFLKLWDDNGVYKIRVAPQCHDVQMALEWKFRTRTWIGEEYNPDIEV